MPRNGSSRASVSGRLKHRREEKADRAGKLHNFRKIAPERAKGRKKISKPADRGRQQYQGKGQKQESRERPCAAITASGSTRQRPIRKLGSALQTAMAGSTLTGKRTRCTKDGDWTMMLTERDIVSEMKNQVTRPENSQTRPFIPLHPGHPGRENNREEIKIQPHLQERCQNGPCDAKRVIDIAVADIAQGKFADQFDIAEKSSRDARDGRSPRLAAQLEASASKFSRRFLRSLGRIRRGSPAHKRAMHMVQPCRTVPDGAPTDYEVTLHENDG